MKKDLQGGLQNILDAINNLIEPKLGNLKYDRTYRGKITSNEGDNTYKVLVNGKEYSAIYTGNKIPVGQIVKVKAPLNNFSDIYIETLPGSGSGEAGNYNDLLNKPILNTNNTGTQVPSATETIQGTISLHKISKTGNYNDLLNKPTLDFIPTSEKGAANGVASLDENGKIVKSDLPTDIVYDSNYVHTDNNFTTAMKDKLDSVEEGAEPNVIEVVQKNGAALPITNKTVNVEVPTKTSDLTNDNGFISSIPVASDTILGGIKVGDNLSITADGVLSAEGGGTTDYSALLNKPILNTANTKSLAVDGNETINGIVSLHKISKTGSYEDLLNKPTIPTKTSDLENDSGFITNTVNDLTNYYLKSETYTQSEVNNLIGQIKTISIEVVDTLPTTGEDNKIYLVPKEGSTGDVYNEYIWVNNTWELIGTTQVDLTGYATEDWVNNQIKDFLTESQVTEIVNNSLTNYYTQTQIDNLLKDKANTGDIPTKTSDLTNDSGFIDNSVSNLTNYYNKTETYNQSEINNLLSNKANTGDIPTKTSDLTNSGDGTTGSKYITNSELNTELENKQDKITGGATTIVTNDLTVNRALISNSNGKVAVSSTTSTELGYLSGTRSNLQTQIDAITTEGGQPNVIEVVQENGTPLEITNKTVNVIAPTNLVNGNAEGSLRTVGSEEESSTYSLGEYAFAEGTKTVATGQGSHSEGLFTVAGRKAYTILLGDSTTKTYSLSSVAKLTTDMSYSIKYGNSTSYNVSKITNIDKTTNTITVATYTELSEDDNYLFIENVPDIGDVYISTGRGSHAEGYRTYAVGDYSHAEGYATEASAAYSHAEGISTKASGDYSHAEGGATKASVAYSHAEGCSTKASGSCSHAEGFETLAGGKNGHAEGKNTICYGSGSHAEGTYTEANSDSQHAQGKYNIVDYADQYAHIVGNGTANNARSNAHTLDWDGNSWYAGEVYVGSTSGTNIDSGSVKLAKITDVPTKTSDITNDSGFLTEIPIASTSRVGGIKVGSNLSITEDGTLNAEAGGVTSYNDLTNRPTLNTNITTSQPVSESELITGEMVLHKISKTGDYGDLNNKPTIPTKTSDLENDSGFITNTVENLTNYYLKSETYTQSEVNNLIGQIKTISIEVVDTLPTTGEDNKIYLVPKEGSTGDVYNEYIWVNNTWELIGTTQVDLTGYATEDWVNNQIKDFLTESQVTEIVNNSLTNYYTQTQIDNLLKDKANTGDIPTKTSDLTNDSGFIDNSVSNLTNYYNKTETYNQSEINNLLSNKANTGDIPTKTSDLTNDSGFITNTVNDLTNYYLKSETYTQSEVNNSLTNYYNKTETYNKTEVDNLLNNKANKRDVMVAGVNRKSWTVSESWSRVNLLPLQYNNYSGNGKLIYTTNGIQIGTGVTKVLASASFKGIDYSKFLGDVYVNIIRKRGTSESPVAEIYNTHFDTVFFSMNISSIILDVQENDLLYLAFGSGAGGTGEVLGAWFRVEVLE